jgi:hypothetical protein
MSASLYFATKKAKNRTCNTMENGVAILWKNVLQLSPKSTCKKQYEEAINVILAVEKSIYILVFIALIFTILILWREKEKNDINFFVALIFTNYIVYLFIEIQVRYRYFIMPSF